ncbi:hypothetical protein F511_32919 [Dorcoceras hygrometricum]|uniref:Uncharacterized protein n=1 Tax=Dorcoceras hygrometricum TaxID=472368 RepID=A0A2Z7BLX3_9LAMI|nr:hypothetical protein F511_32919 [Dorcoceras hygrometricum]
MCNSSFLVLYLLTNIIQFLRQSSLLNLHLLTENIVLNKDDCDTEDLVVKSGGRTLFWLRVLEEAPTDARVVALDSSCQDRSSYTSFAGFELAGRRSRRKLLISLLGNSRLSDCCASGTVC